jgi:hypothetical protein
LSNLEDLKPKGYYSPKTNIPKNLDSVETPKPPNQIELNFSDKWNIFFGKIKKGFSFVKSVLTIPSKLKSLAMWICLLIVLVIILKLFL